METKTREMLLLFVMLYLFIFKGSLGFGRAWERRMGGLGCIV